MPCCYSCHIMVLDFRMGSRGHSAGDTDGSFRSTPLSHQSYEPTEKQTQKQTDGDQNINLIAHQREVVRRSSCLLLMGLLPFCMSLLPAALWSSSPQSGWDLQARNFTLLLPLMGPRWRGKKGDRIPAAYSLLRDQLYAVMEHKPRAVGRSSMMSNQ